MSTTSLPPGFSQFKMSEAQHALRNKEFDHHFFQIDLLPAGKGELRRGQAQLDRISAHYNQPGIYFWVMRYGEADDLYSIYVGKTKSFSNRVKNYLGDFQPHSPNDFKLRIFQSYLARVVPAASLDLLFSPKPAEQLTQFENAAISAYKPLLNIRRAATADARVGLQLAFEQFYHSAFEGLLQTSPASGPLTA